MPFPLPGWLRRITPARTIPSTPWRARGRWRPAPATLPALIGGLWLFGWGEALLVRAGIGVSPWTVLAQGISRRTDVDIGGATFLVSAVVLLLWLPLDERLGLGTLANAVVVALSLGVNAALFDGPDHWPAQVALVLAGVVLIGVGSGLYLTSAMGPGPRDGLMTGLHRRTGLPVTPVRLLLELVVLLIGWALGGTVGVGTVLFALLVGPSVGYGLALAGLAGRDGRAAGGGPGASRPLPD